MSKVFTYLLWAGGALGAAFWIWVAVFFSNTFLKQQTLNKGISAQRAGNHREATDAYSEYIKKDPKNADAYFRRGNAQQAARNLDAALKDFDRAIELDDAEPRYYRARGHLHLQRKEWEAALDDFTEVLDFDEDDLDALVSRGVAQSELFQVDDAIEDLNHALRLKPKNAVALRGRGMAKSYGGDYQGALEDFREALQIAPGASHLHGNCGIALYKLRQWDEALRELDLEGRQPKPNEYSYLWACALRSKRGEQDRGRRELRAGLARATERMNDQWFQEISKFLLGETDEPALLNAAKTDDPQTTSERLCEAQYFAGMVRLGMKSPGANKCFEASVETAVENFVEHDLARTELELLAENQPATK